MNTDNKSQWTESSIRSLRLRLGWSQAELARRLSLAPQEVKSMEVGSLIPDPHLCGELEVMRRQADQSNEEKRQAALADGSLDDRL